MDMRKNIVHAAMEGPLKPRELRRGFGGVLEGVGVRCVVVRPHAVAPASGYASLCEFSYQ